jgi:cytoskeletal protein CcmA (bactofilin family)
MGLFSKSPVTRFDGGDVVTLIGPEAFFHGVLTVRGSLRVEGEVEGSIHEAQTVIIGPNGRVTGDISAEFVEVAGSVSGDIIAEHQLEIRHGGKVTGNIATEKLVIDDGAQFEGNCSMGQPTEPETPKKKNSRKEKAEESPEEASAKESETAAA